MVNLQFSIFNAMKKYSLFLFAVVLCLLICCVSKQDRIERKQKHMEQMRKEIYLQKGFSGMTDFLLPEIIENENPFITTESVLRKDKFACISGTEFGFGTFSNDLKFIFEPVVKGFADDAISWLGTDEKGTILCGKQGYRGFLAVDAETKDTLDIVPSVSIGGQADIFRAYLTELPGRVLFLGFAGPPNHMLYDFANKKDLFIPDNTPPLKINELYKISKTMYLLETFNKTITFYLSDLTVHGFDNLHTNTLTKSLTQKGFSSSAWKRSRPFHSGNRMLIGTIEGAGQTINAVACWDEEYQNVRIEPLIIQCPAEYAFSTDNWTFSLDGKWLYNIAWKGIYGGSSDPELVFYHIDPSYPQHISPPVFAGKLSGVDVNGCFVDHSKLGMVFLDIQANPGYVLVYKMSDMLPIIAKKLAQK
jgi:hypothetical protein